MATEIGTVIQPGESIPDDVTHGEAPAGSVWTFADVRPPGFCWNPPSGVGELIVTAVREQPAPEPPQADASVLLDLVRQYGEASGRAATARAQGLGGQTVAAREAAELFARIAELVQQQPVQARDDEGIPWELHEGCGNAFTTGKALHNAQCGKPGPWRPLLVGGDPAPEWAEIPETTEIGEREANALMRRIGVDAAFRLLAQVMAELGVDRPENVLGALRVLKLAQQHGVTARTHIEAERDAARTAVERLKAQVNAEIEQADEHAAWATRLAQAAIERLDVPITEEAHAELWEAALAALTAAPPPPDPAAPVVLTLPQVPEGAVALVGKSTRVRYDREATSPVTWRAYGDRDALTLLDVFRDSGPELVVEFAPPREPHAFAVDDQVIVPCLGDAKGKLMWQDGSQTRWAVSIPLPDAGLPEHDAGVLAYVPASHLVLDEDAR